MIKNELAKQKLIKNGLPNKKNEKWHYTSLNQKLAYLAINDFAALDNSNYKANWQSQDIALQNYNFISDVSDDLIKQINMAGFSGGTSFTIDKNIELICLENKIDNEQHHIGLNVEVKNNITATILEKHLVKQGKLTSSISTINVHEYSTINYIILNDSFTKIDKLQQFNATINNNSVVNLFIINIGNNNNFLRQEINVKIIGENADFNLRAINLLSDASHTDINMQIEHLVPNSKSREILRNVVLDKAFGAFQGIIKVNNLAQKTEAKMSCNTLILSDDASFSARPELEIFADDVICGHGATVSPINEKLLFYLMSRGIEANFAKSLLIKAFISELLDEYENIIPYLYDVIEGWINNFIQ